MPLITPKPPFLETSRANFQDEIRTPIPPWMIIGGDLVSSGITAGYTGVGGEEV